MKDRTKIKAIEKKMDDLYYRLRLIHARNKVRIMQSMALLERSAKLVENELQRYL